MLVESLAIADVKRIVPRYIADPRGFFAETYNRRALADAAGIDIEFVQDNHSISHAQGVVRGLHFQLPPHAQGKLVRVIRGSVFDVAVDLRHGSPTYGRHVSAILTEENHAQLWVPPGFAHGLVTLEPGTQVMYKVTAHFVPGLDRGIRWDDPALGIDWPVAAADAVLSDRDRNHPTLAELGPVFTYP